LSNSSKFNLPSHLPSMVGSGINSYLSSKGEIGDDAKSESIISAQL
jgi:hypothetical protein